MSASVFPSPKARLLMRAVIPTCGWLFVAIAGALEAQPALARLDADLRHEVAAPRARLAWLERPDGAAHVHAIVRWGAPSASPAAIATAAVLREVLRLRMPAGDGAATAVVPPQDPLLLGFDAINHLELTWRFEGTGPQSWSLGRVLDAPVTDAQVAAARDGVRARLAGRLADPTAVGFAAVAALAEPAVAPDRWDEWLARVSAAEVEALRMTVASGAMWTLGGVGPRASRFAVVSAAADLTGGASAWEDAPPVARDDAAGTGRREAVTRASAAGAAGWGFLAVVRPMPVSATYADWPAMQLAAWLLGASPSRRRFDADVATGGVLGGGAAFDADARGGGRVGGTSRGDPPDPRSPGGADRVAGSHGAQLRRLGWGTGGTRAGAGRRGAPGGPRPARRSGRLAHGDREPLTGGARAGARPSGRRPDAGGPFPAR